MVESVSSTLEDYLEAILRLDSQKGAARVRDIARALGVHKSTVSAALKSLSEKGLVNYSPYELVSLTGHGRRIAESVSKNHRIIKRFLTQVLLVEDAAAAENACRMEHVMDQDVMERLRRFAEFVDADSGRKRRLRTRFEAFVDGQAGNGVRAAGRR